MNEKKIFIRIMNFFIEVSPVASATLPALDSVVTKLTANFPPSIIEIFRLKSHIVQIKKIAPIPNPKIVNLIFKKKK